MKGKVLVTGATGYLGVAVCDTLIREGWEPVALVRSRSRVERLSDDVHLMVFGRTLQEIAKQIEAVNPHSILHLAGPGPTDPPEALQFATIGLALAVADAAQHLPTCPLCIEIGTWWEYDEDGSLAPLNAYAALKQSQRHILAQAHRRGDLALHSLVMHDLYGLDDWRPKLLPRLMKAGRTGEALPMTPGNQVMGWVEVGDAAEAVLKLMSMPVAPRQQPGLWSCVAETWSVRDVVSMIQQAGGTLYPDYGALTYPPHHRMKPNVPAPPPPGWHPSIQLRDVIRSVFSASYDPKPL